MSNNEVIKIVETFLLQCWSAKENDGACKFLWKHDDCRVLMQILYVATGEDRYKDEVYFR